MIKIRNLMNGKKIPWETIGIIAFLGLLIVASVTPSGISQESVLARMTHDFGLGLVAVWEMLVKPALHWLF